MEQLLIDFLSGNPNFATFLAIVGACRLINKPLFALLHAVVDVTATKVDNEYLERLESSKGYKAFIFLIDYFFSVKAKK